MSELLRALPNLQHSESVADRVAYSRDLWPRHHLEVRRGAIADHKPASIVWPANTLEVQSIVREANRTKTPIVPFGAGSGVCAGVLPGADNVVIDMKKMTRVRELNREAPYIDVEAGYLGIHLEEYLNEEGFTLGHFPSSILCSTVGGWVAGRSAGQNSGLYGKIEDMIVELECVTGKGEIVTLKRRAHGPDLIPIVAGSEGTLAIVTSAKLRLHPNPTTRAFASWSFPTTEAGWIAMRETFQAGIRPAVCRLYDPFDAMLAKRGGVKRRKDGPSAPGFGATALRSLLKSPRLFNELLDNKLGTLAMGGAMVVAVFEGTDTKPNEECERMRRLVESGGAVYEGEEHAQRWLKHRYSVSYRQAPVIASGLFLDTMEVAARWSQLGALYDGVRKALGQSAFVMAHLSHAYPDGCCIYFSFAGTAESGVKTGQWDESCERVYDTTWKRALDAAVAAGGTLAHHHGVGRSKAPRLGPELGHGFEVMRGLKRAFDPNGILNPGALGIGHVGGTP